MKLVMMGPMPPPLHGQSIAFRSAARLPFDIEVIDVNLTGKSRFHKVLLGFFSIIFFIKLFFTVSRCDKMYFTCSRSLFGSIRDVLFLLAAKLNNVEVVCHLHGADFLSFYNGMNPLYRKVLYFAYSSVSDFIVLAEPMKSQFSMFKDRPISVVNNFYDAQLDSYSIESKTVKSSEAVEIVYLSNLMTVKGVFVLLDAFEVVNKRGFNVRLKIAGEFLSDYESDATAVKRLFFDRIKLLNNVEYLGVVSGSDKFDLLVSSDIFVLPTYHRSEAVPLSIFEAMAAGCSVITTNHNFLPDIVCKEGAILVEPRDRHSLAEAIFAYVSSPELMASHKLANIEFAKVHYSESVYKERLLSILKK